MAAAFAALVSLQNNLHLIQTHPRHSFSFEDEQIQSLGEIVSFLIEFMKSNDNSHGARKEAAEALEMRIARAAETAEDVIESHVVDQIRSGKTRSKTRSCRYLLDVQKVIEDMDYMRRKAITISVKAPSVTAAEQQQTYSAAAAAATSSTPLTSNKTNMVGREDGRLMLLHQLTGVSSSLQVVPIVGMGGIGKTTLARNAFEDPLILEHFDVRLWAIISQQYSLSKIIAELLSGLRKFTSKTVESSSGSAIEVIHKSLYGQRYLIILDDMWSVKVWDDMKFFFPDTDNGSRIVVTTRHSDVANYLSNSWRGMRVLSEDNSWELFCQETFAGQGCCPLELEEIGKKIVNKCKGLPLTIVVVGGHLRRSLMTIEYWENVAYHMNTLLNSKENDEHCLGVLSLSYSYLPAHLKPCFLLLGVFPEDENIYASNVSNLWIAEGFIEDSRNKRLEEVAEDYLWDLYDRNLILVESPTFHLGTIIAFKLHDLVRELCLEIAKKEKFLYVCDTNTPRAISGKRRVVMSGKVAEVHDHQAKTSDAPIRCLIYGGGLLPCPCDFKLLRSVYNVATASTSESTFQQLNLRFLRVNVDYYKCPPVLYLPSSITLIWNLQLLRICLPHVSTVIAPYEIWEMLQLRFLEVVTISLVDPLPVDRLDDQANELVLRNLHTLCNVVNLRLSEEVCKRIPNIRLLSLSYWDEASTTYTYYRPHNFGNFHQLEIVKLWFDGNSKWRDFAMSLTFPTSLKVLHLTGSRLNWEELTMMVGSLRNLASLQLSQNSVTGSVWTPGVGNFLCLTNLVIDGCDDLIHWNADDSSFPALINFRLIGCSSLDEFPSGIGEISTLNWFQLQCCSESSTISAIRTFVEQVEDLGNENLRLYVTFQGDDEALESFNNKVPEEALTSKNLVLHLQKVTLSS